MAKGDIKWTRNNDRPDYPDVRPFQLATRLHSIKFWDVGTGNCNGLYDTNGHPFIYYDFGGNAGKGAKTYPGATPAFDYDDETVFFISHWDNDHCYSIKKSNGARSSVWIGPRESIAPRTLRALLVLEALFVWSKTAPNERTYESDEGLKIAFHRLPGNPHGSSTVADRRNNTGISLVITQTRPSPVFTRLEAMKTAMNAPNASVQSVIQAAGATGTDFFVTWFVTTVQAQQTATTANQVVQAATTLAQRLDLAWAMASVATAAARAAALFGATAQSVHQAASLKAAAVRQHGLVQAIVTAAAQAATQPSATAADVWNATRAALGTVNRPPSLDTFLAMLDFSLANPTDPAGTAQRGTPGNDPYVNHVIEAAHGAARDQANASNAAAVVDAALAALIPPLEFTTRILLTGDGCYIAHARALPNFYDMPWDVLLAYHHGSYVDFAPKSRTSANQSPAPRPALPGHSAIVYCSGLDRRTRVHGHPAPAALAKYRAAGWTNEFFTAAVEGTPRRGDILYTLPQ